MSRRLGSKERLEKEDPIRRAGSNPESLVENETDIEEQKVLDLKQKLETDYYLLNQSVQQILQKRDMISRKKSKIEAFEDEAKMIIARNISSLVDQNSMPSKLAKKMELGNVLDPGFDEKFRSPQDKKTKKKDGKLP
jgi:hypothetical protein